MLAHVNNFLLTLWLWSITWGMYHIIIAPIVLFILIKITVHYANSSAFFLSFTSMLFSWIIFALITGLIIIGVTKLNYVSTYISHSIDKNQLYISVLLALVYTAFQWMFFIIVDKKYKIQITHMTILALLSNLTTALFMSRLLQS